MTSNEHHICMLPGGRSSLDRLYYYQGNFFHPLSLTGSQPGIVKREMRKFYRANKAMVDADRAHPDYKNLLELFDEALQ